MAKLATCSICNIHYIGHGNNAWPVNDGRCCDPCNDEFVLAARLKDIVDKSVDTEVARLRRENTEMRMVLVELFAAIKARTSS